MSKTKRLYPSPWDLSPEPKQSSRRDSSRRDAPRRPSSAQFVRGLQVGLFAISLSVLLLALAALGLYAYYARTLPSPQELYTRTSPYQSTRIYDRDGELLFEVFDPMAGRRTVVHLADIPYSVIASTVATEDATFYSNLGVRPEAILRSFWLNLRQDDVTFGGSTITQQVVKMVLLSSERTLERKIKEAILAAELTRTYSKDEILEVYLNESYYGNLAYGIFAAAEAYFGKEVSQLDLHEAALLAGILQAPALYDPYTDPEAAMGRRNYVLHLMAEQGYITEDERAAAAGQPLDVQPQALVMEAPHMVVYVRQELERLYGTDVLYKGGLQVYTTLDLDMQRLAEQVASERMAQLSELGASNAALVVLDPNNGDVLAMLGSVDFWDTSIDGQVNVATSLRQPGSSIKPFVYLAALEKGWTPSTMLMDVAQDFGGGLGWPSNYDKTEHGAVSVRTALACSLNIPAVYTLQQAGMSAFLDVARRVGLTSLSDPGYDLSLALGTSNVTLLELTAAYGALANGGQRVTPRTILRIEDSDGNVLVGEEEPAMSQVMDARYAYMLTDILSDNAAREPVFGTDNPLVLPFAAAAKTGTTEDYKDSLTVGYTSDLVTGVWVGNNNGEPMQSLSGMRGAAYIWHDFMAQAYADEAPQPFVRPDGLVERTVCAVSGLLPNDNCTETRTDLFLAESQVGTCTVHQRVRVCTVSGQLAGDYCPAESVSEVLVEDYGAQWDAWAISQGIAVPPRATCTVHTAPRYVEIHVSAPSAAGLVQVQGSAEISNFAYYVVEYGLGSNPQAWAAITPQIQSSVRNGVLCTWNTGALAAGTYTLRVVVVDQQGGRYEAQSVLEVLRATVTPTATETAVPASTLIFEPIATETPTPTASLDGRETPAPLPSEPSSGVAPALSFRR